MFVDTASASALSTTRETTQNIRQSLPKRDNQDYFPQPDERAREQPGTERERERERERECVCVRACVPTCVCVCVRGLHPVYLCGGWLALFDKGLERNGFSPVTNPDYLCEGSSQFVDVLNAVNH